MIGSAKNLTNVRGNFLGFMIHIKTSQGSIMPITVWDLSKNSVFLILTLLTIHWLIFS